MHVSYQLSLPFTSKPASDNLGELPIDTQFDVTFANEIARLETQTSCGE